MSQNATKEIPDFTDVGDGKQCSSGDCHEMTRPKSNTETGFVPTLDLKLMAQKTRELLFNAMKFDSYQNWGPKKKMMRRERGTLVIFAEGL